MEQKPALTPQEMKEKIDSFRARVLLRSKKNNPTSYSLNVVITILSDLLGGLLVGAGIGYLIYRVFETHFVVVGIFVLLGGFAGLLNLYKSMRRLERQAHK